MKLHECFELMAPHAKDAIVVCALGMAANEWWEVTQSEDAFYMHGAMGFASSFALGLAVARPQTQVWILDGDGSLCMNLGTLLTSAGKSPPNFKHFLVANNSYQTAGKVKMVGVENKNFTAIARGAGVKRTIDIRATDELEDALPQILAEGHSFVSLHVDSSKRPTEAPPQTYEGAEMKFRFGRATERRFGVTVFGQEGY